MVVAQRVGDEPRIVTRSPGVRGRRRERRTAVVGGTDDEQPVAERGRCRTGRSSSAHCRSAAASCRSRETPARHLPAATPWSRAWRCRRGCPAAGLPSDRCGTSRPCSAARIAPERVHARGQVAMGSPAWSARRPGRAGDRHQPAGALHHRVVGGAQPPRTGLPEARDAGVDQSRVARGELLVAQAQPVHDPGPEVLHQDVGAAAIRREQRAVLGLAQVERDRLLAAIDPREVQRLAVDEGAVGAAVVAADRRSTLMTRAPRSAISMVANGPASTRLRSTTTKPANGPAPLTCRRTGAGPRGRVRASGRGRP